MKLFTILKIIWVMTSVAMESLFLAKAMVPSGVNVAIFMVVVLCVFTVASAVTNDVVEADDR